MSGQGKGIYYAWYSVVPVCFLSSMIGVTSLQAIPMMLTMMMKTIGFGPELAGQLTGSYGLTFAGLAFIWGIIADKIGPKWVQSIGLAIIAIGFILFGAVAGNSFAMAVFMYALLGFGNAATYNAVVPKLVANWFVPEKRSLALGFITPGGAISGTLGGMIIPPLAISQGWQNALMIIGGIVAVVALYSFVMSRNHPAEKGLAPYGAPEDYEIRPYADVVAEEHAQQKEKGVISRLLKIPAFWLLALYYVCFSAAYGVSTSFISASIVNSGLGLTSVEGGWAMTALNLVGVLGLWFWGAVANRIERKHTIAISAVCYAVVCFAYFFLYGTNLPVMLVIAALLGFTINIMPVQLSCFAEYFPQELRGSSGGSIMTIALLGRYFGPVIAGMVIAMGSYANAWVFAGIASAVSAIFVVFLPNLGILGKKDKAAPAAE